MKTIRERFSEACARMVENREITDTDRHRLEMTVNAAFAADEVAVSGDDLRFLLGWAGMAVAVSSLKRDKKQFDAIAAKYSEVEG